MNKTTQKSFLPHGSESTLKFAVIHNTVLKTLETLEVTTRQFLKNYKSSDGFLLSFILGTYLGADFILKKCTIIKGATVIQHCWSSLFGTETEPLYKNFT